MRIKAVLMLFGGAALCFGAWALIGMGSELATLRVENVELKRQIDVYKQNQKSIESLEAGIDQCFEQVNLAQEVGDRWKAAFESRPVVRETVRVEVPVAVIPEGTPCEAGLARLATWMNREAQHGRIR